VRNGLDPFSGLVQWECVPETARQEDKPQAALVFMLVLRETPSRSAKLAWVRYRCVGRSNNPIVPFFSTGVNPKIK
jgi:hypothetical protein